MHSSSSASSSFRCNSSVNAAYLGEVKCVFSIIIFGIPLAGVTSRHANRTFTAEQKELATFWSNPWRDLSF